MGYECEMFIFPIIYPIGNSALDTHETIFLALITNYWCQLGNVLKSSSVRLIKGFDE